MSLDMMSIRIPSGLAQPHKYELDLTLDSPAIIRMRPRSNKFVPGLEHAEYDPTHPWCKVSAHCGAPMSALSVSYAHGQTGQQAASSILMDKVALVSPCPSVVLAMCWS